jgi:hypothetical protein
VTLQRENLLWLRGQVAVTGSRSVSQMLDQLVSEARQAEKVIPRSVVGTVRPDASDPDLKQADTVVRALFNSDNR